jgi:DNA-directed RNA polymerase alpha subunit
MDTGLSLPFDKRSETLRTVIVGTVEGYDALILAKQQRRVEAEARALERHRTDSIDTLMLTQPTQRALAKAGIVTVGELVAMTEADLRSLGRVNIANIISRLSRLGLGLASTKGTH